MMDLNDKRVCRACGAYGTENGYCANLPGHPFEGVTIEEYVALHPDDRAAAEYLSTRNEEARLSTEWKQVLGMPATVRHVPRPDADVGADADADLLAYGGGPSFDDVYTTPMLDFVFESRNVGRPDGHMAALIVTRNETGLPWMDGWTKGDEVLEALMSAAMTELDKQSRPPVPAPAANGNDTSSVPDRTDPFPDSFPNPFSE